MELGGPSFRGFADLIAMEAIEIYGQPSEKLLGRLHQKVMMLGEVGRVAVDALHAGFTRLRAATT